MLPVSPNTSASIATLSVDQICSFRAIVAEEMLAVAAAAAAAVAAVVGGGSGSGSGSGNQVSKIRITFTSTVAHTCTPSPTPPQSVEPPPKTSTHAHTHTPPPPPQSLEPPASPSVAAREQTGEVHSLDCDYVFACPGRVNRRRELKCFPGEETFGLRGRVAYGSGQDLDGFNFGQKRVVILGHGSFAIENARRALERGALSVTLLARRSAVVMSRASGFLVDRHVDSKVSAAVVLETLKNAYGAVIPTAADGDTGSSSSSSAGSRTAALEALFYTPTKTMFPTSDFYFVARAAGKLSVVSGEVARLEHDAGTVRIQDPELHCFWKKSPPQTKKIPHRYLIQLARTRRRWWR